MVCSVTQRVNVANICDRLGLCFGSGLDALLPSSFKTTVSVSRPIFTKILPSEKTSLAGVGGLPSNTSGAIRS